MKKQIVILALMVMMMPPQGCKVFNNRKSDKKLEQINVKTDKTVKQFKSDSLSKVKIGKTDFNTIVASKEITIKKAESAPLELTAKFRLDTASSLKADTAFKLVDVNNQHVSVTVYQNGKTNELTAKVKTGLKTKDIPFSELQIKSNYKSVTNNIDTSTYKTSVIKKNSDSIDKSVYKVNKKQSQTDKTKEINPNFWTMGILMGLIALILLFLYFRFRK